MLWARLRPRRPRLWPRIRPRWTRLRPMLRPRRPRSWPRLRPRRRRRGRSAHPTSRACCGAMDVRRASLVCDRMRVSLRRNAGQERTDRGHPWRNRDVACKPPRIRCRRDSVETLPVKGNSLKDLLRSRRRRRDRRSACRGLWVWRLWDALFFAPAGGTTNFCPCKGPA